MTSSQVALILLKSQLIVHLLHLLGSAHQSAKELRIPYPACPMWILSSDNQGPNHPFASLPHLINIQKCALISKKVNRRPQANFAACASPDVRQLQPGASIRFIIVDILSVIKVVMSMYDRSLEPDCPQDCCSVANPETRKGH